MADKKPRSKLYFILGLIFVLTIGTVIFIVRYQTNSIISDLVMHRVQTANRAFVNYLSELEERAVMRAEVISGDEAVKAAIKSRDYESLKRYLQNFALGMDYSSICDSNGIVLALSHSKITGDDISGYKAVSAALHTGKTSTLTEKMGIIASHLAIYASAPIFDNGKIIGVANIIYDMTQNEYVDIFKERTDCEATIFLHDERISTTITDESGIRMTGSKAYDFITEIVIGQQQEYTGHLDLFGTMYGVYYSPLVVDGKAIGMLFSGVDISLTNKNQRSMNYLIILASVIGITVSAAFIFFTGTTTHKYAELSEKQRSQQILMANISRSFLSDTDSDTLIKNTLRMVGEFMNIPQLLLFWLEDDGFTLTCRNEWINPKLNLPSRIGGKMPLKEPMLSLMKKLKPDSGKDSCLHSDDPVFGKAMSPYRVSFKNYITTPIFNKGEMCAVIDFSREDDGHKWSKSDISLAVHFASTLSGFFEREAMGRRTSVVENSPLMIFFSDSGGKLVYANPAASSITGYTEAELIAGGYDLILDEKTVSLIKDVFVQQTLKRGMIKYGIVLECRNSSKRLLDVTSFILKDGMVAQICIDLTEIRAMEAELIKQKNHAEQANRARGEFLSTMSHEMRTPMNAIIGMTAIAKKALDDERKNYALNKVEESSRHLLGLINDILDMSKIEANKLELANDEFDLNSILQRAVSFVRLRMDEKRHRFIMKVDENVPSCYIGDDLRLTQVITNLLTNAVKFTPEDGEIGINILLLGEENGICELCFEVTDSGIGISPEQQQKIFNIFEQVDSSTTRKYGGTGLGLTISKRIIEIMGGQINIESDLGKGSRFIFTVKLLRDENDLRHHDESSAGDLSLRIAGEFTGKKLLLAEDIEINREIIVSLLDGSGLIIDTACNGKEAFGKITAAAASYDLIFMDIQMPEMDGLEATRLIRKFETESGSVQRIPIVAMTANVFKDDIENCLNAGMDDHIGKPLEPDRMIEKLKKYL